MRKGAARIKGSSQREPSQAKLATPARGGLGTPHSATSFLTPRLTIGVSLSVFALMALVWIGRRELSALSAARASFSSMSRESAQPAAVKPESTKALYFVSRGDGSSEFSDNLAAHNKAVNQYRRGKP